MLLELVVLINIIIVFNNVRIRSVVLLPFNKEYKAYIFLIKLRSKLKNKILSTSNIIK